VEDTKVTQLLDRIETNLKTQVDGLAAKVEERDTEIRENGGVTPETKTKIEGFETEIKNLHEAVEELKELAPQINEMQEKVNRPGGVENKGRTAPGHRFTESDQYKNFVSSKDTKSHPLELGSIGNLLPERKALTSDEGVWGGAGIMSEPLTLPGILQEPQREIRFRDLVNVQGVTTDSIRYFMETGFANLYALLTATAAAAATALVVDSVAGFFAGQTIVVGGETRVIASGGVNSSTNTLTITAGLTAEKLAGVEVVSDQLAGTAHGGKKPQASIRFDDEVASIITIAHWVAAHRQTLEDAPQLQGYVNSRLLFGLEQALEDQALYGTGTSTTLLGIFNHPLIQDQGTRAGNDPNGNPWTEIDWIRKAMTKAAVAEYPVNGIMVNPLNWEAIELAKDEQGRYQWIVVNDGNVRRLFGVPVSVSTVIRAGQFLLGAFGLGATLLDRQAANIRISDSHDDFFVRNALAILAELRVGLVLTRPEAFIKGAF
jgi:hypothetical protein